MKASWPIVIVALIVGIVIGVAIGGNQSEDVDPNKVTISGSVTAITSDTVPIRLDFIEQKSSAKLSAPLNESSVYSIHLDPGIYRIELTYSIGDIVSPASGFCGTYTIDVDDNSLDIRC